MRGEALESALVVALVLLVPATVGLFTVRDAGHGRAATPSAAAPAAAVLVGLAALAAAGVVGIDPALATVLALLLGGSVLAWTPVARGWAVRGLVAWALTIDVAVIYLAYVVGWTASAGLGPVGLTASVLLLLLEAFMLLIGAGYAWELVDVLARRSWTTPPPGGGEDAAHRPFVSLHVPTHNEPPDMVIATLESLLALEYDDYEVLVVDNNTDDPLLWGPVEQWCAGRERVRFLHLADWPGYKSGALNEALRVSDPRAEVIGIVDADYLVAPDFLAACAPMFAAPDVAFVQTPQDYREWDVAPYFRRLYRSYAYFFDISQRSRAERNGAIFGGTMGLIRRSSLEAAGGWDEWCITEDAELSLRLLRAGGRGLHVDRSFGRGLMPLTFEALKRQRFRWCFGGVQILRMHLRSLLPGPRTAENRLNLAQRWAYLVGGLQWFGDLASVAFTGFLLIGAADLLLDEGLVVRRMSGLLIACVLVLVVLGALRSLALVRRTSGAGWRESLGAFGIWLALGWTVAVAAFRGLTAKQGVFLRTPKVKGELSWTDAVRGNRIELGLALVCLATAAALLSRPGFGATAVGSLLLLHAAGYASAPLNSIAAIRSDLPEELRRRRRDAVASWGNRSVRRGGLVLAATAAVLVAFVALAAPVQGPRLPGGDLAQPRDRDVREADDPPATRDVQPSTGGSRGADGSSAAPDEGAALEPSDAAASTDAPAGAATRPAQEAVPRPTPSSVATPTATSPRATPTPTGAGQKPSSRPTQATQAPGKPSDRPTPSGGGRPGGGGRALG